MNGRFVRETGLSSMITEMQLRTSLETVTGQIEAETLAHFRPVLAYTSSNGDRGMAGFNPKNRANQGLLAQRLFIPN